MFCRKCGAKLAPEERFCPFCGQPVSEPAQASDQASPPPNQPHAPSQENRQDKPSAPPKMQKKKPLIIAVVSIVAVLAVAGTIAFFLSHRNPSDTAGQPSASQPTPSNSLSTAPSEHISESIQPEPSPSNTSTASDTPSESAPISTAPASLSNLYIGTWAAAGDTVGDEANGWQALYLESVNGNSLTFSLESVQASPASRIASTYPITVTITNNSETFPVNDSWGNSGTGTITISNNAIHIRVEITNPDPAAMWDIGMDTEFFPANRSSTPAPTSQEISVRVAGQTLSLSHVPYEDGDNVMVLMEQVFEAAGINVFQDGNSWLAMTNSHVLELNSSMPEEYFDISVNGIYDENRTIQAKWSNDCLYVAADSLESVFDLQTNWVPLQRSCPSPIPFQAATVSMTKP